MKRLGSQRKAVEVSCTSAHGITMLRVRAGTGALAGHRIKSVADLDDALNLVWRHFGVRLAPVLSADVPERYGATAVTRILARANGDPAAKPSKEFDHTLVSVVRDPLGRQFTRAVAVAVIDLTNKPGEKRMRLSYRKAGRTRDIETVYLSPYQNLLIKGAWRVPEPDLTGDSLAAWEGGMGAAFAWSRHPHFAGTAEELKTALAANRNTWYVDIDDIRLHLPVAQHDTETIYARTPVVWGEHLCTV